jgi:hypothetical protein
MNKRNFVKSLGMKAGTTLAVFMAGGLGYSKIAEAASNRNSVTWEVPPGVKKVRVRSWNSDGSKDIDRVLSVEPNQVFRIDVVNS